jgi:6-phosphofructo-2-kinase
MNISIKQRTIWLTTHGESYVDESTGERRLTRKGKQYADALAQFQQSEYFKNEPHNSKMEIWTSMLGRSIEMAEFFPSTYTYKHSMLLNELYPGEFDKVNTDSNYESVIIERLRPVLIELERMPVSVTIIARDVVLGALCAYFFDVPAKDALKLRVPLHTAVCLKPKPFGTEVLLFEYDQEKESFYESVGTWREILGNSSTETFID